jgi:lysophospholipase L1-like esterase
MLCRKSVLLALLALPVLAQQSAPQPLNDQRILPAYERVLQLLEAGGMASPELGRAALPLGETMRNTVESLRFLGVRNPQLHYRFVTNLRAYLLLADTLPKPDGFPDVARQQLLELRDLLSRIDNYFDRQMVQVSVDPRGPDRDNLKRYREANSKLPAVNPKKPRVIFLGDSITDGWRLNEYFPDRDFINRGISGQVTGQMLGRFIDDVVKLKPAAIVVLAGTNDVALGVEPSIIQNNLTMITELADAHQIKVILSSILPVSDYHKDANPGYQQSRKRPNSALAALNVWIQELCQKKGYTYLNYWPALVDKNGQLTSEYADDGLHPNPAGYRVMAPLAAAAIEKSISSAQPAAKKRRLF